MTTIENEYLKIAVSEKGAQLSSFYNKKAQIEHLWQANPDIWAWHAPNLFPVVGQLQNNQLLVNGHTYPMQRHGFARPSVFRLAEADRRHITYSLHYNEETLASYPYKFTYQVIYDLIDNALRITNKVINHDEQPVYFAVGGHPAFNVPFLPGEAYEDYYIEFEAQEALEKSLLNADGLYTGETQPVPLPQGHMPLTRDLFNADALVFKSLQSRQVCIKNFRNGYSITVEFPHYNYLGIWAKPGADFVCIEPWLGCADSAGQPRNISEKEGIQKVMPGHVFEAAYYISI